jgi:hypothetical protein
MELRVGKNYSDSWNPSSATIYIDVAEIYSGARYS